MDGKVAAVKSSSGRFVKKPQIEKPPIERRPIERRPTNVTGKDLTQEEQTLLAARMPLQNVATQSQVAKIIGEMGDKGYLNASGSEEALTGLLNTLTLNPYFDVNELPDLNELKIGGGRKQRGGGDCKWYHKGILIAMLACLWMFGGAQAATWAFNEARTWSTAVSSSMGTTAQGVAQSIGNVPSTILGLLQSCGSYLYTFIPNMPAMPPAFNMTGVQTAWGNAFDIFLVKSSEMMIIMGQAVELELRLGGFGGGRIWKITMDWAAQNWIGIGVTAIAGVGKRKYDALLKENQKLLEDLKAAKATDAGKEAAPPPEPNKGTLKKIMDAATTVAKGATSGAKTGYELTGKAIIFAQEVYESAMEKFCDSIDFIAAAASASSGAPAPEAPAPDLQQEKTDIAALIKAAANLSPLPPLSEAELADSSWGGKRSTRKRNGRTRKPKTRNAKKRKSSGRKAKKVSRKMKSRKGRKTRRRGSKKR
jgi:hypothetical protein